MSKKKLVKGNKVRVKSLSEQGVSRVCTHGKVWEIFKVVFEPENYPAPLVSLKSTDGRNVYFWLQYRNDPHFRITKFLN